MISIVNNFGAAKGIWRKAEDGTWYPVETAPADPYAAAKAAFADELLQVLSTTNGLVDRNSTIDQTWSSWRPVDLRRRPKPDEATTEPSALQEHANLIAKLDGEAEAKAAESDWWKHFGYTPASDRNGIANEAMRKAMTQKPAAHEPPKPQAPGGVYQIAPLGRNARGWGVADE